jgi:hypothetical protein
MVRFALFCCIFLCCGLSLPLVAAQKKDEGDKPAPNIAWMEAGKGDAKATFARQASSAPKPSAIPQFIGEYLWSGRADDQYKPFFMFELRLQGAIENLAEASYRIVTLTHERKPTTTGPWITLGALPGRATHDLSYKLNGPTFPAFQIELKWKGGAETYLVWDKVAMLPVALSDVAKSSFLISLNQNFEHDGQKKIAAISYMLWNIGGVAAKEVSQTMIFKDSEGKSVFTYDFKPNKGEVPAQFVGEQNLTVSKVPVFELLAISTKSTDLTTLAPGSFTGARDVEVADVVADGTALKAKVRNGLKQPVAGLVVIITLIERDGKVIKKLNIPVGDLAQNQIQSVSADISDVKSWADYEVSWTSREMPSDKPGVPATNTAALKPTEVLVDGVLFVVTATKAGKTGTDISGILYNRRDDELKNLIVSFVVPEGKKDPVVVTLKPGTMAKDGQLAVNFTAEGVQQFSSLSLKWVSQKP